MKLRLSVPRVRGFGTGLGNELIPWARAFLAAQVVGGRTLKPAFGLNKRCYWRHFDTPRYDWVVHKCLELILPVVEFKESDYKRHGGGDFLTAFRNFANAEKLFDRPTYLLVTEGMWGGFRHIAAARDFAFSTLYQSRFAARNLVQITDRLHPNKILVAMHIRLGDFGSPPVDPSAYQGRFNLALPLEWYRNIARYLQERLEDQVQFLVVSDGSDAQLKPLIDEISAVCTTDIGDSDCSDLLAMARADLLVCSVSSYSAWAAFLSGSPYIWFEPNLQQEDGFYSIWGHENAQRLTDGPTRFARESWKNASKPPVQRGYPIKLDGRLPDHLITRLTESFDGRNSNADLIQYGVIPTELNNQSESGELCI